MSTVMYSGCLGDQNIVLGAQTLAPRKHFQVFFFSVVFQQKNILNVAINNFTMHVIISKWLRIQKCGQKKKKHNEVETKEETVIEANEETVTESVFIHLGKLQIV